MVTESAIRVIEIARCLFSKQTKTAGPQWTTLPCFCHVLSCFCAGWAVAAVTFLIEGFRTSHIPLEFFLTWRYPTHCLLMSPLELAPHVSSGCFKSDDLARTLGPLLLRKADRLQRGHRRTGGDVDPTCASGLAELGFLPFSLPFSFHMLPKNLRGRG